MFLFTTPSSPSPPPSGAGTSGGVVEAIKQGADATGTDFDYLLRTAKRESALDPSAKAPTSSATGLFQFIEQTWLGVVKSDGDKVGLGDEAKAITARQDGTLTVADPDARDAILRLREQPEIASVMAGALTRQNRDALAAATGRQPTTGELYMAHVLGPRGASDLIRTAGSEPDRAAALDFPAAARANRPIFYDRGGRARGAGEVYGLLASAQAPAATRAPIAAASTNASGVGAGDLRPPGIYGLFQTGARSGPLSDAVARIWRGRSDTVAGGGTRSSFFPKSGAAGSEEVDEVDAGAAASASVTATLAVPPGPSGVAAGPGRPILVNVPLPPARPRDLDLRDPSRSAATAAALRGR